MNALTLQWYDVGQNHTQEIYEQQPSKNPGTIRIGRDKFQCDIVLMPGTVSRLHVEIFFDSQQQSFYIRNLQPNNPPLVDGQQLIQGEKPLNQGSIILLGQVQLQVTAVNISGMAATIINPPQPQAHRIQPVTPPIPPQPPIHQNRQVTPLVQPQPPVHQNRQVTPLVQPQPPVHQNRQITPPAQQRPPVHQHQPVTPPVHHHPPVQGTYGLECPKCHKVSPIENLQVGCPWCGTSLAAAVSVLVAPGN